VPFVFGSSDKTSDNELEPPVVWSCPAYYRKRVEISVVCKDPALLPKNEWTACRVEASGPTRKTSCHRLRVVIVRRSPKKRYHRLSYLRRPRRAPAPNLLPASSKTRPAPIVNWGFAAFTNVCRPVPLTLKVPVRTVGCRVLHVTTRFRLCGIAGNPDIRASPVNTYICGYPAELIGVGRIAAARRFALVASWAFWRFLLVSHLWL